MKLISTAPQQIEGKALSTFRRTSRLIQCLLWGAGLMLGCIPAARANVWPIEDTWTAVGPTTLSHITGSYDNGDGTNENMLLVNGTATTSPQGVQYTFRGTLNSGESVSATIALVNPNGVECRVIADFYSVTDSRVIAAAAQTILAPNSTQTITLNMTAAAADANDQLQLRILRSDDKATTRDFAIDSVKLGDWYVSGPSYNSKTPDLPLLANDAPLQADMDSIINAWYAANLPTPSNSQKTSAENSYNALGIVNNAGVLTGNITSFTQMSYLQTLAGALNGTPSNTTWSNMVNNTVKLVAQNLLRGTLPLDGTMYNLEEFTRDAILLRSFLDQAAIDSLTYVLYRHTDNFNDYWQADYPGPVSEDSISTDEVYNLSDSFLIYGIGMQRNNLEAQRWARGFKRYYERFATPSRGTANGIKVDGSGFHHWSNYENYMYSYNTFITVLSALDTTQLQIDPSYYSDFRDAVIAQFARCRDELRALSLTGRKPLSPNVTVSQSSLKKFALVGGKILGLGTADPEVAKVYNYIYGTDPALGVSGTNPMEGAFQFSYAHLGIYRKSNWTATARGFSSYMWGTETYPTDNRYGRYQSYGSLQILYPGGETANGTTTSGWDWNYSPGATTIVLPFTLLHAERARIDEQQQKSFAGSSTLGTKNSALLNRVHGTYGVFGMNFQELENQGFSTVYGPNTHNNSFVFHKSAFFFDNIIVVLGSNLSNDDTSNNTVTTLSQREANDSLPIVVNGTSYTSSGTQTFPSGSSRWVVGRKGTGYYLTPATGNLVLSRGSQTTPPHTLNNPSNTGSYQTGTFAKLYINHGTAPSNNDYEFAMIPGTTTSAMSSFASSMTGPSAARPYLVMGKTAQHHVVKYQGSGKEIWGLVLFENNASLPAGSVVQANTGPSLVMYQQHNPSSITLSVSDPDLRMASRSYAPAPASAVVLTLTGEWTAASVNTNINLVAAGGQTTLTANLIDGLPQEIALALGGNNPPVFTSNPITKASATNGAAYTGQTLAGSATDVDAGTTLTYSKVSGPGWLTVAGTGALGGTPAAINVGTNSWTVQVSDGITNATATLQIVVIGGGGGPITLNFNPTDDAYAKQVAPTEITGTYTTINVRQSASTEMDGYLKFNVQGIGGAVTGVKLKLYSLHDHTLSVLAVADTSWSETTLNWNNRPTIGLVLTSQAVTANAWAVVDLPVSAVVGNGNVCFALQTTSASFRQFSTKEDGVNIPVLEVTYVGAGNTAPVWDSNPVLESNATEDAPYASTLADNATDADTDPLTFSSITGPAWLSVATNGALSGTPINSDVGTNNWTVQVSDGTTNVTTTLQIVVINVNDIPVFTINPMTRANATNGVAYAGQTLAGSATDVDAGTILAYSKVSGPAWLNVATNGSLSGMPAGSDYGTNSWIVQVSDGIATTNATLQITVDSNGDLDGDGLPDSWEQQYFGNITNAVPSNDTDGDGLTEIAEYISGFNPTNSASYFSITAFELPSGSSNFVLHWTAVDGRSYDALWANSVTDAFSTVVSNLLFPQNSCTVSVNQAVSPGFYRIGVRLVAP